MERTSVISSVEIEDDIVKVWLAIVVVVTIDHSSLCVGD